MMKKLDEAANESGRLGTKSLREENVSSQAAEEYEMKTHELESQVPSNKKEKNISAVKTNKSQRQAKVKITLPLSKNAPTSNKNQDSIGMNDSSKLSTTLSRGKQMLQSGSDAGQAVSNSSSVTSISQPPKIRLSLASVSGGGRKSVAGMQPSTSQYLNPGPEVHDTGDSATSVLEQIGQSPNTHSHSLKGARKLPLQSKSSVTLDPAVTGSSMDLISTFSLGVSISNIDALFNSSVSTSTVPMNRGPREQCNKVLSALIRRNSTNSNWFVKPVNDPRLVDDYKDKYVQTNSLPLPDDFIPILLLRFYKNTLSDGFRNNWHQVSIDLWVYMNF